MDTFGSFANGGATYGETGFPSVVVAKVKGPATYSGKAAGAHHKTGEGVNWFDANATLIADFGTETASTSNGSEPCW